MTICQGDRKDAFVIVSAQHRICNSQSDCKPAASSSNQGSCAAAEKEKVNHYQFYDNSQPVHNTETFVTVNSNHIDFLIAVVLTQAKVHQKFPL